ncbi:hypothetical protein [Pseudomonas sp. P9_31]|uniref:hypothetical protein n=1 Tax=Pseudomonas sp. P9_31 TaxID=3043448 RepID=UPI002A361FB5|nr:hypothetical protein [Pseudomonas sp. P9_31]WPN55460.1 hypothetical protein QMK51_14790 [Pseudomonas sp. P9_31]
MKQFHDYVKDHAERMPDKIALTISGRQITYGALDELACVVARQLVGTVMACRNREKPVSAASAGRYAGIR